MQRIRDLMCNALTAAFDDQPRQFFYEQWYTARTLDERPHYVVGKRGAYRDSRNHFLDLALRKPIEGNLSVMRSHRPGRAKLWPRGVDQHNGGGRRLLDQNLLQLQARRVAPMQILEGNNHRLGSRGSD